MKYKLNPDNSAFDLYELENMIHQITIGKELDAKKVAQVFLIILNECKYLRNKLDKKEPYQDITGEKGQ